MSALPDTPTAPSASPAGISARSFAMHGVGVTVVTDLDDAAALLDDTFGEFAASPDPDSRVIVVRRTEPDDGRAALVEMLNAIATTVSSGLYGKGLLAMHAGALADRGRALVLAGPSGCGKTTLTLGLVRAGLGFLSDELAVLDPATVTVLPYRRSAHVRPSTLDLIPELEPLCEGARQRDLGDGNEWVVTPRALASRFPGCLAGEARLDAVVLLAGPADPAAAPRLTAVPPGIAVMELLRGTPAASIDFGGTLSHLAAAIGAVRCARLEAGELGATAATLRTWFDEGERG
jgi:hypothetical protein